MSVKWSELDGKQVSAFQYDDASGNPFMRALNNNGITKMYVAYEYHGDHDDSWIIVEKRGTETERHNCRFVKTIVWCQP